MDAFDKHIKSLFDNHEVPVDTQELWRQVEPKLGPKRSPGRILPFLLLLIGIPVAYLLFTLPGEQEVVSQINPTANKNSFFGRKGQLIDKATLSDTQQTNKIQFTHKTGQLPNTISTNNEVGDKNKNELIDKNYKEASKENDVKAESTVNTFNSESFDLIKPRIIYSTKKVATNTEIQPVISLFDQKLNLTQKPSAKFNAFKWSIDIFGGFDYAAKNLLAKSYDYNWYVRERQNTEQYVEAFNLGLHFNMMHKSGVFAGTGLVYHQVDELFESSSTREIKTFQEGVVEIITYADGSSQEVTGQKLVIEHKTWNKRKYNNYGFLNIPVFAGYAYNTGMMQVELSGGLDFNLHFYKNGEIIGKEGFPVSVLQPQNSIFRKLTSVNLNGGFKLLYPLSDHFVIYAEPNFHYNLYSISHESNPLEQKYLHTGLRIGTRIKI